MLLIIFSCLLTLSAANVQNITQSEFSANGVPTFPQLALKYGWNCEEYDVVTEDGYILKVFHITGNESKKPVLLMHGILDSADSYVIRGEISIAINLAEAGYDVWAGNVRGNKYSRRNVNLSPDKNKYRFWDFTFHEMGIYDLPATIDFILAKTGKQKLSAIGHSQGTTMFYALGSVKPEYNEKISVFISLAPIAYLNDISTSLRGLIKLWPIINGFFIGLGYEGVLQDQSAGNELVKFLCTLGEIGYDLCVKGVLASLAGEDSEQLEPEFLDVLVDHYPAGTSRKAFSHYVQISNSGRFAQYDYGTLKNMILYKKATPPAYDLWKVTMPTVLLAGKNDGVSGIKDVERLRDELGNVVRYHVMEREKFNHVDFVWGKNMNVYMTPLLRDLLREFA
ncbi:lipase 1-like [Ostrinia furnacalis]|uniref:lipase 1-like n=1 Tax=Ostrinia furnacalis TaxID=93504 RepID=UPI0010387738|nr:lipase 1-like [Ostrinia furnacalis]